jgi:MFS family permease
MWQPFREPVFRALWISAFVSNVGSLMQDVAAAWLMTSLTSQPFMVALLQTAANAPFFVLGLVAGALADSVDRRILLIIGQAWMGVAALALGLMTVFGVMNPWWLLALTFVMGLGAAVTSPAWNAMVPELVSRDKLEKAIALNSVGYNTARGIGSAAGGLLVANAGSGAVFLFNAVSFIGVIGVLLRWKRPVEAQTPGGREPLFSAIKAGMRFARHSPGLRAVFFKTAIWATCTSAMWALIPLIARVQLKLQASQFGLLLAAFGVGSLIGATLLPKLRERVSLEATARIGIGIWALAMACMAWSVNFWLAMLYMMCFGTAWIIVNSCLNIGVQMCVASWVRARALALYILIFQGSVALGSAFWGKIGDFTGLSTPLLLASLLLSVGLIAGAKYHLGAAENVDTTPSGHWVDPEIVYQPLPHHGPVMVTVEYNVDPANAEGFTKAIAALSVQRKRDGAYKWNVFCDLSDPRRFVESFLIENWGEHCRQHDRAMNADIEVEKRVDAFHTGEKAIKIRHMISAFAMDMQTQLAEVPREK